jgi:hypothetical protein
MEILGSLLDPFAQPKISKSLGRHFGVASPNTLKQHQRMTTGKPADNDLIKDLLLGVGVSLFAALGFYFSTKATQQDFDYTARIALTLIHGHLGLQSPPPSWLNEIVPGDGNYYSVFPLGAVLSLVPVVLLQQLRLLQDFPGHILTALIVGFCVYFFFRLSSAEGKSVGRRVLLALFPIFGTWAWCNLGFGGAWQLALGFALLGETASLYFVLVQPRPVLAGAFFALAFGNRTELVLTFPLYVYLLLRWHTSGNTDGVADIKQWLGQNWRPLVSFLIVPVTLALLTAAYNFARFQSILDFGYARIPQLLQEPWYQHGLFSLHAIPWNLHKMLFEGFEDRPSFPYLKPYPFGCSIFISSPFLLLLFREGGKYKRVCWIAIAVLTFVLLVHGNPGGWQFSYRYAIILLPWMFLLLVGNGPVRISAIEVSLFVVSVAINAMATYQFLWTTEIHP